MSFLFSNTSRPKTIQRFRTLPTSFHKVFFGVSRQIPSKCKSVTGQTNNVFMLTVKQLVVLDLEIGISD